MKLRLSDPDLILYAGDALTVLRELPADSVDCCVTSPPYWGLRDYGSEGQVGLESTPQEYVERIVEIFREVRRVLAPHGTVWLNLGDSYAADRSYQVRDSKHTDVGNTMKTRVPEGLKAKDLVGIPWRVAFALQDDGWWLRSDIIWSKSNPMPESVSDRPTKSHEYVFLLTKSGNPTFWSNPMRGLLSATKPAPDYWWHDPEYLLPPSETLVEGWNRRNAWKGHDYFFDQDAVREPAEWNRWGDQTVAKYAGTKTATGWMQPKTKTELNAKRSSYSPGQTTGNTPEGHERKSDAGLPVNPAGRNIRSVWNISTQPYAEAHFATFPEELPRRAIAAGCPVEVCKVCGKPRVRITTQREAPTEVRREYERKSDFHTRAKGLGGQAHQDWLDEHPKETIGWTDCGHDDYRAGVVMDPFAGAGTTALVARSLERHSLLIELSDEYCDQIATRLQQLSLLT